MKVAAVGVSKVLRTILESWGWDVTETNPDAHLTLSGQHLEIRVAKSLYPDDIALLPINESELRLRIELAHARRARLAKRLHDLRSPLNAIQGYAEILAETAEGDALRFASNIRTASEILTAQLESIRDDGV